MSKPLRIFLIAGESSGDFLGAGLMRALKEQHPDIQFTGVGGSRMIGEGLRSLFPMEELSVMGLAEVLPKLFHIMSRIGQTASEILKAKPDVVITIDSPDFCFRVIKKVKAGKGKMPCIHYVAPSVWAWRPGRAKKVSRFLDHILTLLPFEPPYFEKHGLAATFVGHPIVERTAQRGDAGRFRKKYNIADAQKILCLLPGSRMSELSRLLEKFGEAMTAMLQNKPDIKVVVPTLPHLKKYIQDFFAGKGIDPIVIDQEEDKFDCFAAGKVALAASGTVSLELALTRTPHIIAYRLSAFSGWIARHMIKTPYANLINILVRRLVVPELLQDKCQPERIAQEMLDLMDNKELQATQLRGFQEALVMIGLEDPETPSQKAAKAVLSVVNKTGAA
jgi:lipid-A-disaccharide synthase